MTKSIYLEKLTEDCSKIRKTTAKKTLISTILLIAMTIAAYIGMPLLDSRAKSTSIIFSSVFGLVSLIFLLKFILLSSNVSRKILKCEQEIDKNLKGNETFENFYNDITNPAFGEHKIDDSTIAVGHNFVLFQKLTAKGPRLSILRGDELGQLDVQYSSEHGVGTDFGVDINNKNGKFIRSFMTSASNKDKFYELLNALENIKSYANGENAPLTQSLGHEDNEFVSELKDKVNNHNKKGLTKTGIFGILFGIFLIIASINSGKGFAYAGIALIILSIIFIVRIHIKAKNSLT